jgi:hypothetical protein
MKQNKVYMAEQLGFMKEQRIFLVVVKFEQANSGSCNA